MDGTRLILVLNSADAAVRHAVATREAHAKKTSRGSTMRQRDLEIAQDRLKRAMAPVRSELSRLARKKDGNPTLAAAQRDPLKAASLAIQRERRKLWKMQPKRKKRANKRKN